VFKRNPHNNKPIFPDWYMYIFGAYRNGMGRLPLDQGGGYYNNANIIRRTRKYYREGWKDKYTLREFLRVGGQRG
jgi:hypothetical protein